MKILLVEPDKLLASNITTGFAAAGHDVCWQVDPQESVNCLDDQPIDAIVMDLVLCQHSAVEMLYEMRSYREWQDIPVIIFSSLPTRDVLGCVTSLEQLGVKAYHHKSFTRLTDLIAAVENRQPALAETA